MADAPNLQMPKQDQTTSLKDTLEYADGFNVAVSDSKKSGAKGLMINRGGK